MPQGLSEDDSLSRGPSVDDIEEPSPLGLVEKEAGSPPRTYEGVEVADEAWASSQTARELGYGEVPPTAEELGYGLISQSLVAQADDSDEDSGDEEAQALAAAAEGEW